MSIRHVLLFLALFASAASHAQPHGTALVRHAPTLSGVIEGSVHQMTAESVTLNGNVIITGDLLIAGTPTVRLNGKSSYQGTFDRTGESAPSNHSITLNGNAALRHVLRRSNPLSFPAIPPPPEPTGTRSVTLNNGNQTPGDFTTLRHLTLNGNAGTIAVPPGSYGDFTANGGGFVLGSAGATEPAIYHLQRLTLNGSATLTIAGPTVLTVANSLIANGAIGTSSHPEWLALRLPNGSLTLNGSSAFHGYVLAPAGTVLLNGNSRLIGGITADRLTLNGNALLRLINLPSTVSFTEPAAGAIFNPPATIRLAATAADQDGAVSKIEFFNGNTKLGEAVSPPYQFSWANIGSGTYTLTAIATDNSGSVTSSATVEVIVNAPPTVALNSPASGAVLVASASVPVVATASDSDGTVIKVEFFNGTTKLGESLAAPYQFVWSNAPVGHHTLTALATDNRGKTTTSAPVSVQVRANQPPSATLTSPAPNATFTAPASFTLSATATDPDDAVTKVEFFQGTTKLGEDHSAPFDFAVTSLPAGSYTFTARSHDQFGAVGSSAPTSVTVSATNQPPVATSRVIQLNEDATANVTLAAADPDNNPLTYTIVRQPAHGSVTGTPPNLIYRPAPDFFGSDSFTYKAHDGTSESAPAVVAFTIAPVPDAPTIVLRSPTSGATFTAPAAINLVAEVRDADGDFDKIEFFQNGTKLGETSVGPFALTAANLAAGDYTFMARVTDATTLSANSANVQIKVVADPSPTVELTAPAANTTFAPQSTITLRATATSPEGAVSKVEFYCDDTKLGEAATAPYEFPWTAVSPGRYTLAARVITSTGATALSSTVSVRITGNQPPSVVLLQPENGISIFASSSVMLGAQASDPDNSVRRIEFYSGETSILTHTFSIYSDGQQPMQAPWTPPTTGTFTIFARAFDSSGASGDSAPVTLHVTANRPPDVLLLAPSPDTPLAAPATVQLSASASDQDGSVAKVEFYANTAKLAELTAPPYAFTWTNVTAGSYIIRARAYDNAGAVSVSATSVYVAPTLPYLTSFEAADGFTAGPLDSHSPWRAQAGSARITDLTAANGAQSIVVRPGSVPRESSVTFAPLAPEQTVVFYDFWAKPIAAAEAYQGATFGADGVRVGMQIANGRGEIYATEESDGTFFAPTGVLVPLAKDGAALRWHRFTFRQDYSNNQWDLWVDGALARGDVRFNPSLGPRFGIVGDVLVPARLDGLLASFDNPLFVDTDKDGMSDTWEIAHGLNPNQNDRYDDLDGDNLTNIHEHALGLKPNAPDSDGDGLPDRWELENSSDPRWPASLKQDTDGDGLPDRWEYANGTEVWNPDSDGDGISDSIEDEDGDGLNTLAEFQRGTHPKDYFNGVPAQITPLFSNGGALGPGDTLAVRITASTGEPLINAPAEFTTVAGNHLLAATASGPPSTSVTVRSGADGIARVYVRNGEN